MGGFGKSSESELSATPTSLASRCSGNEPDTDMHDAGHPASETDCMCL